MKNRCNSSIFTRFLLLLSSSTFPLKLLPVTSCNSRGWVEFPFPLNTDEKWDSDTLPKVTPVSLNYMCDHRLKTDSYLILYQTHRRLFSPDPYRCDPPDTWVVSDPPFLRTGKEYLVTIWSIFYLDTYSVSQRTSPFRYRRLYLVSRTKSRGLLPRSLVWVILSLVSLTSTCEDSYRGPRHPRSFLRSEICKRSRSFSVITTFLKGIGKKGEIKSTKLGLTGLWLFYVDFPPCYHSFLFSSVDMEEGSDVRRKLLSSLDRPSTPPHLSVVYGMKTPTNLMTCIHLTLYS